jgi:RNA polymerase sigma factor (sigma-70 family)
MPDALDDADDEDLVRRLRSGDQRAAELGASDIVQETCASAFAGLDGFEDRGPGSFRRWLATILEHKAADEVKRHLRMGRSARREVSAVAGAPAPEQHGDEPTPSVAAMRDEDEAALRSAIARLEGDHGAVLALVYRDGRDFADAARVMGRSPEAVRKLYGRAVLQLGREMRRSP